MALTVLHPHADGGDGVLGEGADRPRQGGHRSDGDRCLGGRRRRGRAGRALGRGWQRPAAAAPPPCLQPPWLRERPMRRAGPARSTPPALPPRVPADRAGGRSGGAGRALRAAHRTTIQLRGRRAASVSAAGDRRGQSVLPAAAAPTVGRAGRRLRRGSGQRRARRVPRLDGVAVHAASAGRVPAQAGRRPTTGAGHDSMGLISLRPPLAGRPGVAGKDLFFGEVAGPARQADDAPVEHVDLVGQGQGPVHELLHQEQGGALRRPGARGTRRSRRRRRGQAGRDLVEEDDGRVLHVGPGHGQHLLLAAAHRAGPLGEPLPQAGKDARRPGRWTPWPVPRGACRVRFSSTREGLEDAPRVGDVAQAPA